MRATMFSVFFVGGALLLVAGQDTQSLAFASGVELPSEGEPVCFRLRGNFRCAAQPSALITAFKEKDGPPKERAIAWPGPNPPAKLKFTACGTCDAGMIPIGTVIDDDGLLGMLFLGVTTKTSSPWRIKFELPPTEDGKTVTLRVEDAFTGASIGSDVDFKVDDAGGSDGSAQCPDTLQEFKAAPRPKTAAGDDLKIVKATPGLTIRKGTAKVTLEGTTNKTKKHVYGLVIPTAGLKLMEAKTLTTTTGSNEWAVEFATAALPEGQYYLRVRRVSKADRDAYDHVVLHVVP